MSALFSKLLRRTKDNHTWFWVISFLWVIIIVGLWYAIFIKNLLQLKGNETGQTIGYFIGGIGVATIAMVSAGRRTHALMKQVENDQVRVTNENFTKSIELLGHDEEAVRHGGLFSLQRMMTDKSLYPTIVKIVTSYIRHQSQQYFKEAIKVVANGQDAVKQLDKEPMKIDVEAALSVLRSRLQYDTGGFEDRQKSKQQNTSEEYLFDLSNSKLFNADLSHTRLDRFNLSDCQIRKSFLTQSSLVGANLTATDFTGTDFTGTDLSGVDLSRTTGLTQMQINQAMGDATTTLPNGLTLPDSWK
jgi:hypothetical protein